MKTTLVLLGALGLAIATSGCATTTPVDLLTAIPVTGQPDATTPMEVVTHSVGAPLSLRLSGTNVRYVGVETSLGHAVATAVAPWAARDGAQKGEGWQLIVDLWDVAGHVRGDDVEVRLGVRATLRTRQTHNFIAQTQVHCMQAGRASANDAAPTIYACMSQIGRELAGWLGGVQH